jgi:hypothetical protein
VRALGHKSPFFGNIYKIKSRNLIFEKFLELLPELVGLGPHPSSSPLLAQNKAVPP